MKDQARRPDQLDRCRACASDNLMLFLPMGDHPPANMFVRPEDRDAPQPAFPLNTQACLDCGMIQVADQIPDGFFTHYLYVPSGARTMHGHFEGLAGVLTDIAQGGLIVDVGCNDGLMLSFANRMGARTLGIDPAANLVANAAANGVEVHVAYFGPETAAEVRALRGPAQVISTTNTLNHIGDLHGFMEGVRTLLSDDGWFVVEVPWGRDILLTNQFDNVYHEHMSEMSLMSLVRLAEATGMAVVDVTRLPVHGGSMRVFMRKAGAAQAPSAEVTAMLEAEREAGMQSAEAFVKFAQRVEDIRDRLVWMLADLKAGGARIAGYGAAAKGNTLLNYCGVGPELIPFTVDRSHHKQGHLLPGVRIPIKAPQVILDAKPDYVLILPWNFKDEIVEQMAAIREWGGKFVVPIPELKIL